MGKTKIPFVITADLHDHPAVTAWKRFGSTKTPDRLEVLKQHPKSLVCRLHGLGPQGQPVIAKRVSREAGAHERIIYERVFPYLPLPQAQYFGSVGDADTGLLWMFFEDLGEVRLDYAVAEHRLLLVEWLKRLHSASYPPDLAQFLPDRGVNHYHDHLVRACAHMDSNLNNPSFSLNEINLLRDIKDQLERVRSLWPKMELFCSQMPKTIVHGDLKPKHLFIQKHNDRLQLAAIDWEMAGWGKPAPDLEDFFLHVRETEVLQYWESVKASWPGQDFEALRAVSDTGRLLRLVAAVSWASEHLTYNKVHLGMPKYASRLGTLVDQLLGKG